VGAAAPPQGWNNCQIDCAGWAPDDSLVRSTAVALNQSGLARAGYRALNLDDAWMGDRTASGIMQPNSTRFPDFLSTIAFVRSQGLQLGVYTAAGESHSSSRHSPAH
jgi:alpha-galactosidase